MLPILPHNFSTKTICIVISMVMAVSMYVSLFRRLRRRHHSRDFSKGWAWLNFGIQLNNGVLAFAEHAPFLVFWYIVQALFTGATIWLVYRYWDNPSPSQPPKA